jgi:hypothetical protein
MKDKDQKRSKKKRIRTSIYLDEDLWKQLKHEAIDKNTHFIGTYQ